MSTGTTVTPNDWRPGSFRGDQFEAFPHLLAPGQSASQQSALSGLGVFNVPDRVLRRTAVESLDLTTSNVAKERPFLFNAPNCPVDITRLVKRHAGADLMVVRANYPCNRAFDKAMASGQDYRAS